MENTIVWSDNSSYGKLRHLRKRRHGSMAGRGRRRYSAGERHVLPHLHGTPVGPHVVEDLRVPDDCRYLTAAQWLSDTFGKTEVSFLRNGALGTRAQGTPTTCRKRVPAARKAWKTTEATREGSEESTAADGSKGDGSVLTEDAEGGQTRSLKRTRPSRLSA